MLSCFLVTLPMFAAWSEAGAGTEVKVVVVDRLEDSKHTDHDGGVGRTTQSSNEMNETPNDSTISQGEDIQPLEAEPEPFPVLSEEEKIGETVEAAENYTETEGERLTNQKESVREKESQAIKQETGKKEKTEKQREKISKEAEAFRENCHCLWARLFGACILCLLFRRCLGVWCWLVPILAIVCMMVLLSRRKRKNSQQPS